MIDSTTIPCRVKTSFVILFHKITNLSNLFNYKSSSHRQVNITPLAVISSKSLMDLSILVILIHRMTSSQDPFYLCQVNITPLTVILSDSLVELETSSLCLDKTWSLCPFSKVRAASPLRRSRLFNKVRYMSPLRRSRLFSKVRVASPLRCSRLFNEWELRLHSKWDLRLFNKWESRLHYKRGLRFKCVKAVSIRQTRVASLLQMRSASPIQCNI